MKIDMIKNLGSNPKEISSPEDRFELKLSGRSFTKGFDVVVKKSLIKRRVLRTCILEIDLDINADFFYCDLKDEIELIQKESNKIIF